MKTKPNARRLTGYMGTPEEVQDAKRAARRVGLTVAKWIARLVREALAKERK